VDFTLQVAWLAFSAVAQQPRGLAHRLPCPLIGNAVNHDYGDAFGRAHRISRTARPSALAPGLAFSAHCIAATYGGQR
jgi:hypothetical protein